MSTQASDIIRDFERFINQDGSPYNNWYVGISENPERRLFTEHGVDRERGGWKHLDDPVEARIAREVEEHFVRQRGTDGGTGGGDADYLYVYAYLKESNTRQ